MPSEELETDELDELAPRTVAIWSGGCTCDTFWGVGGWCCGSCGC